jgi:hypothetical protein
VGWQAAVARLHPEALADFHYRMTLLVEMDTTRAPLDKLYPVGGLEAYHRTSAEGVFLRVMEVLSEDAPGLAHALVVRDVEIIGSVPEGSDLAHVVYRSTAQLSGAVPEMRIMTMKKDGDLWRVLSSQELDILVEAFRGISRRRAPPPGGWPGGIDPDTTRTGPQTPGGSPVRSRWQSEHSSPRRARMPSHPMMGTMANPAIGSAHHHPRAAFSPSPARRMAER